LYVWVQFSTPVRTGLKDGPYAWTVCTGIVRIGF